MFLMKSFKIIYILALKKLVIMPLELNFVILSIGNWLKCIHSTSRLVRLDHRTKATTCIGRGAVRRTAEYEERFLRLNAVRDRFFTSISVAEKWLATGQQPSLQPVYHSISQIFWVAVLSRVSHLAVKERVQCDHKWNRFGFTGSFDFD